MSKLVFLALIAAGAGRPPDTRIVEMTVRGNGKPDLSGQPPPKLAIKVDPGSLPLRKLRRFDAQYGGPRDYQGVPLRTLIDRFRPDPHLDLALLRFSNGMVVPLPFRDGQAMKRLDPFVAIGAFPEIPAKGAETRAVAFVGNKVVVAERWHPAVDPRAEKDFSPWEHIDSLVGIELVESGPYYRQFDVGNEPQVRRGFALFQQTCQFCHGARKVGAQFGWDLVEPYPAYSYRRPDTRLYYHIAYNPFDATEKGIRMPALRFMTKQDASALWQWMKAIAERPMDPYAPVVSRER